MDTVVPPVELELEEDVEEVNVLEAVAAEDEGDWETVTVAAVLVLDNAK